MNKQSKILWIPRSFIIFIWIILLLLSVVFSNFYYDESISILINVNLLIILVFFIVSFYRAKISGILYFVYACIMIAYIYHSFSFLVVIPMAFILISGILLVVLPEKPKNRDNIKPKPKKVIPKWIKQGIIVFLLICTVFLFTVHKTVKTNAAIPDVVIFPKYFTLYDLVFLEDPNNFLSSMQVNFRRYYPTLYQGKRPDLKTDQKAYLEKRNSYIRSFEKRFVDPANVKSNNPFNEPYQKIQRITEFLPVKESNEEGILLITRTWERNMAQEDFSDVYYLNSNFHLLDQVKLSSLHEDGSAIVSAKYMDRIWLPTYSLDNSDPRRLTNSTISKQLITIQVSGGKIVIKESEGKYLYAYSDEKEVTSNFDQYRFVNISTNPTLTFYKEPAIKKVLISIKHFTNTIDEILQPIKPAFPYILFIFIILLLLYYHGQTITCIRKLRQKNDIKNRKDG